jgi:tetratricopeptide (TPR) repeat protein
MENQTNFDPANQSETKTNDKLKYIIGTLVLLLIVSLGLYFANQDYFKKANQPISPEPISEVNDGLDQYFTNEEKKLAPDVFPPEEVKQYYEQDIEKAKEYIKIEEVKETGSSYQGYMAIANDLRGLGKYEESEKAYQDMITRFPDDELIFHNLGVLYEDMHQYLSAARAYSTSIEKKPVEIIAHTKLADLYLNHSTTPAKAKEVYLKALQDTENHKEIVKAYASYLETVEKNLSEALLYWEQALTQSPNNDAIKQRVEELQAKIK